MTRPKGETATRCANRTEILAERKRFEKGKREIKEERGEKERKKM